MSKQARIGFVTISDRASRGEYEDLGGPAMQAWMQKALISPWEAVVRLVPDEQDQVEAALKSLCDDEAC
ncbi:MAG: molybdopterin adenylyltransferase, partial [Gammaproteobacteria bacterium]|nr:molybdopterin adenylyltransferase [Gammaproteobacteria bacterium]